MDNPVELLHANTGALAKTLESIWSIDQISLQEDENSAELLQDVSGRVEEMADNLRQIADSITTFWARRRSADERVIELVDRRRDADLSIARQRREEIARLRDMMREIRTDFDGLGAHFDRIRTVSDQPGLDVASREAIQACKELKDSLQAAESHAEELLAAYDALL